VGRRRNLGDLIDATRDPAKAALIDLAHPAAPRVWSHGELARTAAAVGRGLLARGLARGDRVGLLGENSAEYFAAFLGAMRAGLVAVPISVKLPLATLDHILRDADVRLVLADAARMSRPPRGRAVLPLGEGFASLLDPGPLEPVPAEPGEIALILYTSGSTGMPKGVPLTHAG